MSKVTELKIGGGGKDRGCFRVEVFNLFDQDSADDYAELRTRANNASSGVEIEYVQQFVKKSSTSQGEGEDRVVDTTEELHIVVQYWEKSVTRDKGDTDDDVIEARLEWSREREASG